MEEEEEFTQQLMETPWNSWEELAELGRVLRGCSGSLCVAETQHDV